MKPEDLDRQSPVHIDRWLSWGSDEERAHNDDRAFTKEMMRLGLRGKDPFLFTDLLGRIWGKNPSGIFYPFHFEVPSLSGGRPLLYGLGIPQAASN